MSGYIPGNVYVAAAYMAPVGRFDGSHREKLSFLELAAKCSEIFSGSGIKPSAIEAVIVGSQNPGAFSHVDNTAAKIAGVLGASGAKSVLIDTASSSGASAFESAYMEIASGRSDTVLAMGIQKMSDAPTLLATEIVAGVIDREEAEYGLSMPACGALVAKAIAKRLKLSPEEWSAFSALLTERAHRYASKNPDAHLSSEIPVSKYYEEISSGKNYLYWDPLRYHDFCPMSDGVAAVILTSKPTDIVVAGVGSATDLPTIADRRYFHSFPATVRAASHCYGMAGIRNIAEFSGRIHINMHDPFNGFGPVNMIDLGLLPKKHLLDGLLDDALTGENGKFPTNLTGGLKGRGHPLGATGMIQIVENFRMIIEKGFDAGLSHSIGGPINNNVVILIEKNSHFFNRSPLPYKPWGMPLPGKPKPLGVSAETVLDAGMIEGEFITSTTRFHHKSKEPLNSIIIISSIYKGENLRFLFGISGENYPELKNLKQGDRLTVEKTDGEIKINSIPVKRFFIRGIQGMLSTVGEKFKSLAGS